MLIGCISAVAYAGDQKENVLPPRAISVSPAFTGVIVPQGEAINIDLLVTNGGRRDEDIDLSLSSVPEKWKARIKTYDFAVNGVYVPSDDTKTLTLRIETPGGVPPGTYPVDIRAHTRDNQAISTSRVMVTVREKVVEKKLEGVSIITSYPVLKGPTDGKFEFSLEIENESDQDSVFNLAASGPENWEVSFKPAYEDKYISSLRLKADQRQTVAVEVKPNSWSKPGSYPVSVTVDSAKAQAQATLTVVLTGTYRLDAGTANGLLSLSAVRGEKANLSFYVQNNGSATLNNVRFLSFQPENWKVEFTPESIDVLPPQQVEQVEIAIIPAEQALVGDYSVGLRVESGNPPRAEKTIELRVGVTAAAAWGWIGIGMIVLVMAGLVFMFIRLGRR
ncbi:MAG: NEW3 domain-containing protein [Deltaproteobacteria bacterium]|nr:NEW3 domain-containing protein [Deltaproteobacteria bacterium]